MHVFIVSKCGKGDCSDLKYLYERHHPKTAGESRPLYLPRSTHETQASILQPPCPTRDTFTKTFEIKRIRNTSDKERSTYDFTCRILNQRGKVCMVCDRATMFPFFAPPSPSETPPPEQPVTTADRLRDHVVKQSEKLGESG